MTRKLLLTGFEPFLNFTINPTEEIVKELDQQVIGEYKVESRVLPVDFTESEKLLLAYMEEVQPDAVVCLGLAAGRAHITPERIAINCKDAGGAPDNNGVVLQDTPINQDGPDGYFSTLPIRAMVNHLNENHYPAKVSNTAGTYLCNNVMYAALNHYAATKAEVPAGFIHIPASHQLATQLTNTPSWSQADLTAAMKLAIEVM
ncbi:Pyrrolidone-carboxylate peptidase [Bacillus sp. THAF10]|uniref:pyroglutamyl-peptidase I n=1 Tax=Bacillus sp. THAF10 TaxID=2587848 RepID=UPI00126923E8|nr:pyroglutamyl-peptidase I [Bacillus sp. THAF10]QFT90906.1 Pyrrolidone-carboxylate peptidase [Bacillus sp. THAF10]